MIFINQAVHVLSTVIRHSFLGERHIISSRSSHSSAAMLAAMACAVAIVILDVGGCHPSSIGSLSCSKRYLIRVAFPLPSTRSPNADKIRLYSRSDVVWAELASNSGFVAAPYSKRAVLSAAATAN